MAEPIDAELAHALVEWAAAQDVMRGATEALPLPPALVRHSAERRAHVAHTRDGRRCVLVKTDIGYKGNFKGIVACDAPLRPEELVEKAPRPYLTLPGVEMFEELYVSSRIDDRAYRVFFDLN
jgi:hypothetical protein